MKPLRQGTLDGTCGLYAVVNAVRLAMLSHRRLSMIDCKNLYGALVKELERKTDFFNIFENGLWPKDIAFLLSAARTWTQNNKRISLVWHRPFLRHRTTDFALIISVLTAHLDTGGAVIAGVRVEEEHWSVIQKISKQTLILFDSDDRVRLKLARIAISPELTLSPLPHRLYPEELFLLSAKE